MDVYDKIIQGLEIFKKYEHEHGFSPDHDIVYAGPKPADVSAEDIAALSALGWSASAEDCFYKFL